MAATTSPGAVDKTAITARAFGRSDDNAFAILRQFGPGGAIFRWPDPNLRLEDNATAVFTITRGTSFTVQKAGSYVFLRGPLFELIFYFDLLPELPPRVDLVVDVQPAEVAEGVEAREAREAGDTNGNRI